MEKTDKKMVWVSSRTGKAVHLVDTSIIVEDKGNKDYQRLEITPRMAEQNIPVLVHNTSFIQRYYTEPIKLLSLWVDEEAARKAYNEHFKIVTEEQKVVVDEQRAKNQLMEQAIKKAREAFETEMNKQNAVRGRPKIIRTNQAGEQRVVAG